LFAASRYHAVFTDSPLSMLGPGTNHRTHAVMEQVHADLRSGQLAHLPSGSFAANGAWSVLAAMAFNLTRAAGALASLFHAKPTTTTIRDQLITVPARLAHHARRLVLHLPEHWPWQVAWEMLIHRYLRSTRPYHYLTTPPPRAQPETEVKKPADRPIPHTSITAPKVHKGFNYPRMCVGGSGWRQRQ